jgi:hypothetical protein
VSLARQDKGTTRVQGIVPNLVYAGSGHEVKTVIVAGKVLVRDGQVPLQISLSFVLKLKSRRRHLPGVWGLIRCIRGWHCRRRCKLDNYKSSGLLLYLEAYPFQKATAQFSPVFDGRLIRAMGVGTRTGQ